MNKKSLDIPQGWKVTCNHFFDLEPDNNLPIDDVYDYFDEDILYANFGEYFIDLGYYGSYLKRRKGFFRMIVAKGSFGIGELFEHFISRSTDEIKAKLDYYFNTIPTGQLEKANGYLFGDEKGGIHDFAFYSAVQSESIKLSSREIKKLMRPSNSI